MKLKLKIEGMSCPHCEARVVKALTGQTGVSAATVSLALGQADVVFDETVTSPYALCQAVGDAGFDAQIEAGEA